MEILRFQRWPLVAVTLLAVVFVFPRWAAAANQAGNGSSVRSQDLRAQSEVYISYYNDIELTPEEMGVRDKALAGIPAPCCDSYSAATCCCVCNLARSIWGLSNYLIHEEGHSAEKVRGTVLEWLAFTNPNGYSGKACFSGGCGKPFSRDGCGGMAEGKLVL